MPAQRRMTAAEWLTLIADRAPALRAAGVESLTVDGVSVTLTKQEAAAPAPVALPAATAPEPVSSPLYDAATYADGNVPGFDLSELEKDGEPS